MKINQRNTGFAFLALVIVMMCHALCLGRYPAVGGDDVFWSPTAYNYFHNGVFASPTLPSPGLFHIKNYLPPILTVFMKCSYQLFGFGIVQTKLVTLLCGILSMVLVGLIVFEATRRWECAYLSLLCFACNRSAFSAWGSGRPEAVLVLFFAISVYLYLISKRSKASIGIKSFLLILSGASAACSGVAYYQFFPSSVAVGVIMWLFWNPEEGGSDFFKKIPPLFYWGCGYLVVLGGFILFAAQDWTVFTTQIFSKNLIQKYYFGSSEGVHNSILNNIFAEYHRYAYFLRGGLGAFFLGLIIVCMAYGLIKWKQSKSKLKALFCMGLFVAFFLSTRSNKVFCPIYPMTFIVSIMAGLILDAGAVSSFFRRFLLGLLTTLILAGLIEALLFGFTAVYQWDGRDYRRLQKEVEAFIPEGARVLSAPFAWYALAGKNLKLHLMSQGYDPTIFRTLQGDDLLENKEYMRRFDYVLISARYSLHYESSQRILRDEYYLLRKIDMDFKPLPWAQDSPYDLMIYKRR